MYSIVPLILLGLESHYATDVPYDTVLNLTRGDIHSGRGVKAGGSGAGRGGAGRGGAAHTRGEAGRFLGFWFSSLSPGRGSKIHFRLKYTGRGEEKSHTGQG